MKYLLDTHILLWAIISPEKLSKKVRDILINPENIILVSAVCFWEISLKYATGKLVLQDIQPEELLEYSKKIGFTFLRLTVEDAGTFHLLPGQYHKDPFDRMLIWQALQNNYIFISDDKHVKKYVSVGLKLIS